MNKNRVFASFCSQIKYNKSSQIKHIFKGRQVTLMERLRCCSQRKVQVEETRAVSAWPRQEFTSSGSDHLLEMISMSHECDVQVVGSWRLFALKVPCTSCFLGQWGRVSERTGGQLESCPSYSWLGATWSDHGLQWWAAGVVFGAGKLRFLTDGQGKLGESDVSHSTYHLSIQIFLAWLKTRLSATAASSLAWLFCRHILQQRFLVLHSATSNLLVTSFRPDLDPLTLSESQDVSGSSWESVDPNASRYKVGFTWVHNLTRKNRQTDYLSWSVCYLQVERLAQRTL